MMLIRVDFDHAMAGKGRRPIVADDRKGERALGALEGIGLSQ